MKLARKKGATSQTVYLFIQDSSSTTGAGLTGLAFNTASLVAYYVRGLGSATAITLATQTVTGTYSSGGFVEVSSSNMPGVYRLDIPNTALATGADSVVIMLKGATNMAPVALEIDLDAMVDVSHWNGTAVATPVTAGVPIIDIGYIGDSPVTGPAGTAGVAFPTIVASPALTAAQITTDHGSGSYVSDTGSFNCNVVSIADNTVHGPVGTGGITFPSTVASETTQVSAAGIRTAIGLGSANLDTQLAAIASYIDTEIGTLITKTNGIVMGQSTIGSTGNDTTHVHIPSLTYADDQINDCLLVILDVSASEYHARWIDDWVNSTKLATVGTLPFTPQNAVDNYWVMSIRRDVTAKTIGAGAITNASFTMPTEPTGFLTTGILGMLWQMYNRVFSKTTYNKSGLTITTTKSDGSTTSTTQAVTTNSTTDVVDKAT